MKRNAKISKKLLNYKLLFTVKSLTDNRTKKNIRKSKYRPTFCVAVHHIFLTFCNSSTFIQKVPSSRPFGRGKDVQINCTTQFVSRNDHKVWTFTKLLSFAQHKMLAFDNFFTLYLIGVLKFKLFSQKLNQMRVEYSNWDIK